QGTYPDKPIRLVVPFSVGGGTDVVARVVAKALSDRLGQPIIVENRAGAGSTIGTGQVAKSAADGYTLLFASASHAFSPTVYRKLAYSQDDFAAIAVVNTTPLLLAAHPSVPAKNLREFLALLKANPGKYNYGSSGKGTTLHMAAELFNTMAGVDVVHVPYKGEAPAMTDLLGGQIAFMVNQASSVVPLIKSGKLNGLGVTTPKRLATAPEIPTIAEAGVPGFAAYGWNVILAPKGTPREVITLLNRQINAVIASPEVKAKFDELGLDVLDPTTPDSATAFVAAETAKWAPIIRAAGVQED
ncbi:MAG: tripartite tricarboxylate transporter substrate binding protein, partial [Burkholderiaceae bacterium]